MLRAASGLGRIAAFALDYLLIAGYLVILTGAQLASSHAFAGGVFGLLARNPVSAEAGGFVVLTLPVILYFAISEASDWRGTLGKSALHVQVTDRLGNRISSARSLLRSAIKFTPWQLAHTLIYQIAFNGPQAARSPLVLAGFATVYLLAGAYVAMLFVGTRRTLYDRLAGTMVVRA